MSATFVYKDVHGNTVDKNDRPEPMDCIIKQSKFIQWMFSDLLSANRKKIKTSANVRRNCVRYTAHNKATLYELKIETYASASAAEIVKAV